ncbi:MAG TPA: cytochrome P450, partial [Solirubrobacterales bacterium]|nr:cytochrome P450 [Solirubrobacterales bacterium]
VHAERIVEFQQYFLARIEERRDQPGEDVVSFLANATIDDGNGSERPLDTPEVLGLLLHFVTAGSETTTNLLGSLVYRVLGEPGLADRLRADPDEIAAVVEEALRCEGPVQGLFRRTTKPVELGGVLIPADEKVLMLLGSANLDDGRFEHAERFDPGREDGRRHLAFGFGIHFCLGAPLARKEAAVAVETLLRRLPGLRIAAGKPAEHHHQTLFRGFSELHLAFDGKRS